VENELPASSVVMLKEASGSLTVTAASPYQGYAYLPEHLDHALPHTTQPTCQFLHVESTTLLKEYVTQLDLVSMLNSTEIVVCHRIS
jgi:hypothetical protein